ncbi:gntR family Bacterial regulatory protein [Eggerthella sp. CAG:1427]|nr:gntR family Bacterial regulatory protein [Eggerthella sp. CAG:1427]
MIIRIEKMSEEPLYLQIRSQIIGAIARGELRAGDSLPSVRSLAADLGINLHTVNKAYAVLRDEGYLIMRGRSGAFVAEPLQDSSKAKAALVQEQIGQKLQHLIEEHKAAGGSAEEFLGETKKQIARVYEDPGVVGPKRNVGVLGVDTQGNYLNSDLRGTDYAMLPVNVSGILEQNPSGVLGFDSGKGGE